MHSWRATVAASVVCAGLFGALLIVAGVAGSAKPSGAPTFPQTLWAQAAADDFLGAETCGGCHPGQKASFAKSAHLSYVSDPHLPKDRQGCEACHGPGKNHLEHLEDADRRKFIVSYSRANAAQTSAACLRCHGSVMRDSEWHRTAHARGNVGCVSCHKIHVDEPGTSASAVAQRQPKDPLSPVFAAKPDPRRLLRADEATLCGSCHRRELAEFKGMSHHPMQEGRIVCSDCHELHPDRHSARRKAASSRVHADRDIGREVCVTCHAQTAGPFAFEHDPAAGFTGEGCLECHRPHGSNNPRLLTTFSRGVCNQCHTDKAAAHYPGRSCWEATGCHVAIHGSNTDKQLLKH
jgi:predicted CXXCH cytochrome family protein